MWCLAFCGLLWVCERDLCIEHRPPSAGCRSKPGSRRAQAQRTVTAQFKSGTVTRGCVKERPLRTAQITGGVGGAMRRGIQILSPHNSILQGVSFICSNFQRLKNSPPWWMKCFREVSSAQHQGHCIPSCSLCLFSHLLSFLFVPLPCPPADRSTARTMGNKRPRARQGELLGDNEFN